MTKPPRDASLNKARPHASAQFGSVLAELNSLGDKAGGAVGDLYAVIARALLNKLERLDDWKAERRHRLRSEFRSPPAPSATGTNATAPQRAAQGPKSTPTHNVTV